MRERASTQQVRVSLPVKHVLQTILQHAAEAFGDKTSELSDVLNPINNPKLREVHWHSNPGNVIEALLYAVGLGWSVELVRQEVVAAAPSRARRSSGGRRNYPTVVTVVTAVTTVTTHYCWVMGNYCWEMWSLP